MATLSTAVVASLLDGATKLHLEGRLDDALHSYQSLLRHRPDDPSILLRLGALYGELNQTSQAETVLSHARRLDPRNPHVHHCLGLVLEKQGKSRSAIKAFEAALDLYPGFLKAESNLANALMSEGRYDEAAKHFARVAEQDPSAFEAQFHLLFCAASAADWKTVSLHRAAVVERLEEVFGAEGKACLALPPLVAILLDFPFLLIRALSSNFAQHISTQAERSFACRTAAPIEAVSGRKLRIAYMSPDFNQHAVGFLVHRLFEHHDRSRFEIAGYSLKACEPQDPYRRAIHGACDSFFELEDLTDSEALALMAQNPPDILFDLAGYTKGARPTLLARRPATAQCAWMGYPGTSGSPFIDYQISHKDYVPPELLASYTEDLVLLPETPFAAEPLVMPNTPLHRRDLGLPEDKVVFCCFHQAYRLEPGIYEVWMRILRRAPNSILWLLGGSKPVEKRLQGYAEASGISASRLFFTHDARMSDRWVHRVADVWLDTYTVSGGTSGFLCAWAELPMLTAWGPTPQARTGALVMVGLGLEDWVVPDLEAYEARAVEWAHDPDLRTHLKTRLRRAKTQSPLFDGARFVRYLERAAEEMLDAKLRGRKGTLTIAPLSVEGPKRLPLSPAET